MVSNRELLFSVTASDCHWDYFRCPGPGGQKVNKTSSGVRCKHLPSGAVGQSCDERSQVQNKKIAFSRMANDPNFERWRRIEAFRRMGELDKINEQVSLEMKKIKVEIKENGVWVEVDKNAELDMGERDV